VVANILASILISLASTIAGHTKPQGKLAMSGIVNKQAEAVVQAYKKHFARVQVEQQEDDWVLVTAYDKLP
jgi:ribosomal protein L11 methyltransferase